MPHSTFMKDKHIFKMKEYTADYMLKQQKWISKVNDSNMVSK